MQNTNEIAGGSWDPPVPHASIRYEAGISKALRMQPSAPALGTSSGSKDGEAFRVDCADDVDDDSVVLRDQPASALSLGCGHLLTRLSLHGQGVRTIEGLEACYNLRILVSKI